MHLVLKILVSIMMLSSWARALYREKEAWAIIFAIMFIGFALFNAAHFKSILGLAATSIACVSMLMFTFLTEKE